jgi:uncharacterized protein YdaU (DUF1376 family)
MSPTRHRREAEKYKMAGWTWFPFDVIDWLTSHDVLQMSAHDRGVYITILAAQWRDGSIPADHLQAAKVLGFDRRNVTNWLQRWSKLVPCLQHGCSTHAEGLQQVCKESASTLQQACSKLANAKLREIAAELGNSRVAEGAEERREEERRAEESIGEEREEKASPLKPEKDKTSKASERSQKQNQPQRLLKPCRCADGLCDWSEPILGCSRPESIGDAVYYQRHVKRNEYFTQRLSAGYVREQWKRLLNDTPEDWSYDPDPLIRQKSVHLDGLDNPPTIKKEVVRRPKNAAERALLQNNIPHNRKWLYDPACPNHCKEGLVEVSDYPDDPRLSKLTHSEYCECVAKEEAEGAGA